MAHLSFAIICVIWGSSFILMKRAVVGMSPTSVAWWRLVTGGLALGLIYLLARRQPTLRREHWLPLLGIVLLGFVWPYSLQPAMIPHQGSAFVGMMVGFTPLLTILVSIPILGVWPTSRQVVGVLGALACLAALAGEGLHRHISPTGFALTISVPFAYAIANSWIRRSLGAIPSMELTLACLLLGGVILTPLAWMSPQPVVERATYQGAVTAAATLGLLGTGLSTYLFTRLVQSHGPLFAGMVTNVVPIGALMWGWADGETVTTLQIVALFGLIAMVSLVQFNRAPIVEPTARSLAAATDP